MSKIVCDNLSKTFNAGSGKAVHAVRGVSFSVKAGEIFGLLGPNGAGKTTLLRMLATIITPTAGRCVIDGIPADRSPEQVRHHIGFLSGSTRLYRRLTGREMLQYFGRLYGLDEQRIARRIDELVGVLDMEEFVDRRCETYSTGQAQRVSISRVILHEPPVLILDEPTLGLDIMSSRTILSFIRDARAEGHSIIFSTHYMTEAEQLCDRIGFLHRGKLMAEGRRDELYAQTGCDNLLDAFVQLAEDAEVEVSAA